MTNNPFLWNFIKHMPKTMSANGAEERPLTGSLAEENRQAFIELDE